MAYTIHDYRSKLEELGKFELFTPEFERWQLECLEIEKAMLEQGGAERRWMERELNDELYTLDEMLHSITNKEALEEVENNMAQIRQMLANAGCRIDLDNEDYED